MDKLKLEPTAALVMQWSSKLYEDEATLKFIRRLDLSSGQFLYNKCHSVCSWYAEIILNRKHFVKLLIKQQLDAAKGDYQLVFLAAGKSPLSIDILMHHSSQVYRIFEVDVSGMKEKTGLYMELFPELMLKLKLQAEEY
jgi:hypothetical protein